MKIYADGCLDHNAHTDSGATFEARCPKCRGNIRVAEYSWWSTRCSCGIEWELNIEIYAEATDE